MLKFGTFVLVAFLINVTIAKEKLLLCYYGSWAHYRQGNGACPVSQLDPFMCTHLIYTFVGLNADATIRIMDPWLELPDNWGKDNFAQFNNLKKINPKLKTIIAIGRWNEGSAKYSTVANNPTLRSKFVKEAATFTMKYGFDGFDLDWEYPGQRDSVHGAADIEAHALLIKEMREEFDKHGLLLTAAVAAVEASVIKSYNITALTTYLHYIHVMSYDFHGAWDHFTGHNAALRQYEDDKPMGTSFDYETVYNFWLKKGADKNKLIMGLPVYGRTFTLADTNDASVGAPVYGAGTGGQYTNERGFLGLNELCEQRLTQNWPELWDKDAEVPYTHKGGDWITYDDHKSLKMKVDYAMKLDLAGVMIWSIETDDFRGICHKEKFAFLRTINKAIGREVPDISTTTPIVTSSTESTSPGPTPSPTTPTTTQAPTAPPPNEICHKEGFVRDKHNCAVYYRCVLEGGQWTVYRFQCSLGLYFDDIKLICDYEANVKCDAKP